MFANSVISRSSISFSSLLLSSLLTFFSFLSSSLLPLLSSLSPHDLFSLSISCRLISSSCLVLREQWVQSTIVIRCRITSGLSAIALPSLCFFLFLSVLLLIICPFLPLSYILLPRLSFIYRAVRVSVSSTLRRSIKRIYVTHGRSVADYFLSPSFHTAFAETSQLSQSVRFATLPFSL